MSQPQYLYLHHLFNSISYHKKNTLAQKGQSDIDTTSYDSSVNIWFDQLYEMVINSPPEYYVEAINVYETNQNIEKIEYDYFPITQEDTRINKATINLAK